MSSATITHTQDKFLLASLPIGRRLALICGTLGALLVVALIISAANGPAQIPYGDVGRLIARGLGFPAGLDLPENQLAIVNQVRLPRILVGMLVGAALATSGATIQGVFRNPLADPSIIGVTVGGSLGAVIAISTGLVTTDLWILPGFAFLGALGSATLVYVLSLSNGKPQPVTLLLAGVAINALLGALISALLLFTNRFVEVQAILSWLIGGLRGKGWGHAGAIVVPVVVTIGVMMLFAREINLLLLGDETAQGLGVSVPRTRFLLLAVACLATGAAVSVAGPIGFIGLVVPHVLRLIVGPDYRLLLPASALGGAIFLVSTDTIARLVLQPAELQVGIVTALLGAPFFLFLLYRNRKLIRTL
jgi:iron complex transport system permease protein